MSGIEINYLSDRDATQSPQMTPEAWAPHERDYCGAEIDFPFICFGNGAGQE